MGMKPRARRRKSSLPLDEVVRSGSFPDINRLVAKLRTLRAARLVIDTEKNTMEITYEQPTRTD